MRNFVWRGRVGRLQCFTVISRNECDKNSRFVDNIIKLINIDVVIKNIFLHKNLQIKYKLNQYDVLFKKQ